MDKEIKKPSETSEHLTDPLSLIDATPCEDFDILFLKVEQDCEKKLNNESSNPPKRGIQSNKNKKKEEFKIQVGPEFQAVCPPLVPFEERNLELIPDRALTVWLPNENLPDAVLQPYITLTHNKFGYNIEQALAMLFWHKYNLNAAIEDLGNFGPCADDWTPEDKIIFERSIRIDGKNFNRIREVLPDKTVGELVDYYYTWKKHGKKQTVERRGRPPKKKMLLYDEGKVIH